MTRRLTEEYFENRTFYQIQSGALVDNPDQRISSDVRCAVCDFRKVVLVTWHNVQARKLTSGVWVLQGYNSSEFAW